MSKNKTTLERLAAIEERVRDIPEMKSDIKKLVWVVAPVPIVLSIIVSIIMNNIM